MRNDLILNFKTMKKSCPEIVKIEYMKNFQANIVNLNVITIISQKNRSL